MIRLGQRVWPRIEPGRLHLLVPVGSCEQHGPHLPLDTDTRIAGAVCEGVADRLGDAVVAPAIAIEASGEHQGFPGTLSIGTEVLTDVVVELVRSADEFASISMINGHGGNATARPCAFRLGWRRIG